MKEKCWKQLKKQLCPKEKWVPDNAQTKCLCCGKQFKMLIRRKHHCRFCGSIFCSDCSDYFINGNYLDQIQQKHIRHCEFCHKKIEKFIKDWTKLPEVYDDRAKDHPSSDGTNSDVFIEGSKKEPEFDREAQDFQSEEDSLDDDFIDDSQRYQLQNLFLMSNFTSQEAIQEHEESSQNLEERMNKIMGQFSNFLCQKWGIDVKHWKNKLTELSLKGAIQTKMDPLAYEGAEQNAMDIARKIKIKTMITEQSKAVQIIMKGIILQKNPPTKHANIHLSKPKVLIIQKSIDLDSLTSFIKFEQLIKNDKAIMKKILEKIVRLNPDIIFVEQNVHVFALEYLQSKEIVVISKLKIKQLELIKQVSGIKKSVKKLWMLERYKPSHIVGKCDKIYFKNIRANHFMMFMEADVGIRTILLGEESQQQVNTIKRTVQILMRIARQMNLEKHFILTQRQVEKSLCCSKKQLISFSTGFSPNIYKSLQNYLLYQQISFTKISYRQVRLSQCPKNFLEYGQRLGKTSYKQICGKPQYLSKKIYTSADMTLGGYILLTAVNHDCERVCKKCNNHHQQRYYVDGYEVIISVQKKLPSSLGIKKDSSEFKIKREKEDSKDSEEQKITPILGLTKSQNIKPQEDLSKASDLIKLKQTHSFLEDFGYKNEQITLQKLKSHLNKQKQIIIIENSAQCQLCGQILCKQPIKLGKFYLSNSFYYILYLLVQAAIQAEQNEKGNKNKNLYSSISERKLTHRKLSIQKCGHQSLVRIYEYSGISIKIQIQKVYVSSIDYISLYKEQSQQLIETKQKKFIQKLYFVQLSQKKLMLERLIQKMNNLSIPLQNTTRSVSFPASLAEKVKVYMDSCSKLKQILEKCQNQLKKQVQQKCYKDLDEKKKPDWTFYIRKILKVDSIIRMGFVIVESMEHSLKRKKIEQNIQSSPKDNETLLEYEDIKELLDDQEGSQDIQMKESVTHLSISVSDLKLQFSQTDSEIRQYLKNNSKKRYPRMQGSYLHFHTANINDPVGLLACAVNSIQYRKSYEEYQQMANTEMRKSQSASRQSGKESKNQFTVRVALQKVLKTDWPPRVQLNKIYTEIVGEMIEKLEVIDITTYYPKQFEQLRKDENIDNEMYTRGLCTCQNWNNSGGKSNSLFAKSENDLLVVKVINQKQFEEFLKFTRDYLIYVKQSRVVGRNTLLAQIYGIYEVIAKGKAFKCIVMQNIFFGITNPLKVYDLKGSEVNRLNLPAENQKKYTGQDTNFKIDKSGEPYALKMLQYEKLIKILEEDSNFLKDHAVIDYSLLVIETKDFLRLGIIDYMRPYQLIQKLENIYKQFKSGRDPTVIPPSSYAQRFLGAMKKYFIIAE